MSFGPSLLLWANIGQAVPWSSCSHGSLPLCSVVKWATFSPFRARRYSVGHCEEEASRPPVHTLRSRSESCQTNGEVLETTGSVLKVPSPSLRKGPMPLALSCCFARGSRHPPEAPPHYVQRLLPRGAPHHPRLGILFPALPCGLGPELCAVDRCRRRATLGTSRALARQGTHRRQNPERFDLTR